MPVLTFCTISVCVCVWCTYGPAGLFLVTVIALVFTLCSCVVTFTVWQYCLYYIKMGFPLQPLFDPLWFSP